MDAYRYILEHPRRQRGSHDSVYNSSYQQQRTEAWRQSASLTVSKSRMPLLHLSLSQKLEYHLKWWGWRSELLVIHISLKHCLFLMTFCQKQQQQSFCFDYYLIGKITNEINKMCSKNIYLNDTLVSTLESDWLLQKVLSFKVVWKSTFDKAEFIKLNC